MHYYLTASNGRGHGIHSPFVFNFIKVVLNDRKKYPCYLQIENLRKKLLSNYNLIDVEDFGAGSAILNTKKRMISKIASSSLKSRKFSQLLFRIALHYKPSTIVELGTSFGITTSYMASGNKNAAVFTMEGASSIAAVAKDNFQCLALKHIHLVTGEFAQTLPMVLTEIKQTELAFIDGNHTKVFTLNYFKEFLLHSTAATILIFDDIHWSAGMEEAWSSIQQHSAVTLTIDLFFLGLVFINPDVKVKQHFIVRF